MTFTDPVEVILKRKGFAVHSISPDATVYDALCKMAAEDIGALVVLEGAQAVGIFSERDYARKVVLKDRWSRAIQVHEIMSAPVLTVSYDTTVDECLRHMTARHHRHLPVVRDGAVVGLVSIGDLVQWVVSTQDFALHQLEGYIMGKYPS
jgi:CBS domain-containing protein